VTLLRAVVTNVDGSGIRVAQPEAGLDTNNPATTWEVNPANVGQPTSLFTYKSSTGSASTYPNSLGTNSWHAEEVGNALYGIPSGIATNVAHVDNYEANYFYNNVIAATLPPNINDVVVNQSFTFGAQPTNTQEQIDSAYDNYSAQYKTLFISAVNNGVQVCAPGTSYNCIGVAAYGGSSSTGPTLDNGRCKPDITAPAGATSFSTPQVSGAAALLMQAALRGDGGGDTNSAADTRTVKALLLNGAVKPADWTNVAPSPLDFRYGAGVLNVFNSYEQLAGGKQTNAVQATVSTNSAHSPIVVTNFISALSAWNFSTNTSSSSSDAVTHYFFNVTNAPNNANFSLTTTLVWTRHKNKTAINNLDLFLFNCASSNLVACSTSLVDNVEHIFLPKLPPGRYDLQVWKAGGNFVSSSEGYALAWNFSSPALAISNGGTNVNLSWPIYPAGFAVAATTNLSSPNWSTNNLPTVNFTNGQNQITIPATNSAQFFRLQTPNF
jgi:hypothetical protein